jgi:hypothetical protein
MIITISKVTFAKSCRMVQCMEAVTEELFCKHCLIAVAVCLHKTFLGDTTISNHLSHHPIGKYEVIPPVEVCLKSAYCSQLMNKNVAEYLLK